MFKKDERVFVSSNGLPPELGYIINDYPVYFVSYLPVSCGTFVEVSAKMKTESIIRVLPRKNCFHMIDSSLPLDKRMELFAQDYIFGN